MACKIKRKLWSPEDMQRAITFFESNDKVGLREAARLYNVPVETLRRRIVGTIRMNCKPGRETILTCDEESSLQLWTNLEGTIHFLMDWLEEDGLMGLGPVIQTSPCVLPSHCHIAELLLPVKRPLTIFLLN